MVTDIISQLLALPEFFSFLRACLKNNIFAFNRKVKQQVVGKATGTIYAYIYKDEEKTASLKTRIAAVCMISI